jgi:S1-C subfamily serine protease
MRFPIAALLSLALAGCATSSGMLSGGFLNDTIARAYLPLEGRTYLVMENRGAAVVIAPGIAVTNAHNGDYLSGVALIGKSRNYDLLFFHVDRNVAPPTAAPAVGEHVIAYGQGSHGEVRVAVGVVSALNAPVEARCQTCAVQSAFIFEGNAGPGFSGGPVVDAISGKLIGITFGFLDPGGRRMMYAYPMSRVRNELATIMGKLPADVD